MKKFCPIILLLLAFVGFCSLLHSTLIEINHDGSGNHTTIQAGINSSADGDTVLVHPGTYYENVNFNGHHITLASLEFITGNEVYIDSTIINGNQTGNCIKLMNEEQNAVIRGFSVTNGCEEQLWNYSYGGGIVVYTYVFTNTITVEIINCKIFGNVSTAGGGGVLCRRSNVTLSGVDIFNNQASSGGGILASTDCFLNFDEENLCNIYNNYAGSGSDIYAVDTEHDIHVFVDTFTVMEPEGFFALYIPTNNQNDEMTLSIQNAWMEEVNSDLFVSTTGNDDNSGTSPAQPLKTIAWALHKAASDSLNPKTVYVESGTYSKELNGQIFPLGCKNFITLCGDFTEKPVLLNTYAQGMLTSSYKKKFNLLNFRFQSVINDCSGVIIIIHSTDFNIKNVIVEDFDIIGRYIFLVAEYGNYYLENVIIRNNTAAKCGGLQLNTKINAVLKNCVFDNNYSTNTGEDGWYSNFRCDVKDSLLIENCVFSNSSPAGNLVRSIAISGREDCNTKIDIVNSLFYNNSATTDAPISIGNYPTVYNNIVNCTFVNNTGNESALILTGQKNIVNSIFLNPNSYEISLPDLTAYDHTVTLNVSNSNIQGGEEGIYNENEVNIVNWLEGNIDEDPLFLMEDEFIYSLSELSPCIDAGTTDLPEGITLPEYDLAGNPRIYGDTVDMGAFEWQPVSSGEENTQPSLEINKLSNYPNPFNPNTTISFSLNNTPQEKVQIIIYNIKGQLVEEFRLTNYKLGVNEIVWDAEQFSSGVYFYKLTVNNKTIDSRKMLLLK
jgi:hypothetical protein